MHLCMWRGQSMHDVYASLNSKKGPELQQAGRYIGRNRAYVFKRRSTISVSMNELSAARSDRETWSQQIRQEIERRLAKSQPPKSSGKTTQGLTTYTDTEQRDNQKLLPDWHKLTDGCVEWYKVQCLQQAYQCSTKQH